MMYAPGAMDRYVKIFERERRISSLRAIAFDTIAAVLTAVVLSSEWWLR